MEAWFFAVLFGALGIGVAAILVPIAAVSLADYFSVKRELIAEARREMLKAAAEIARERGDWELADTEGRSGQRMERARIAHDIEFEILKMVKNGK